MTPDIPIIVDTDAGPDDVLALAYLLARPDVRVEAVTVAYGLAHPAQGAVNMARVIAASTASDVPVYVGRDGPLEGQAAFPDHWRMLSDELPGVTLPETYDFPRTEAAAAFLARRLSQTGSPACILALGALTNLVGLDSQSAPALKELVVMGGAFDVPGNVHDSGEFISPTRRAEWNLFVDPVAAKQVLESDLPATLIPLDATNHVPITTALIDGIACAATSPLGQLTADVLALLRPYALRRQVYAWDPLAAVYLTHPEVVNLVRHPVRVITTGSDAGTIVRAPAGHPKEVARFADATLFERVFCSAFGQTQSFEA